WYTDGLVERRDEDIDQGLHRLQRLSSQLADADPQTVCDTVVAAASAGGPLQDDVAVICLRLGTR
ncbi:MAG: serine/threonine-protein phosphatase, partial [Actinomycetia bacterium]|nr:serine/threonine-protein phosphatase [Actinomycetes bacterium]